MTAIINSLEYALDLAPGALFSWAGCLYALGVLFMLLLLINTIMEWGRHS